MFSPAVIRNWPACPVEIPSSAVVLGAAVATNGARWMSSSAISASSVVIRRATLRSANLAALIGSSGPAHVEPQAPARWSSASTR